MGDHTKHIFLSPTSNQTKPEKTSAPKKQDAQTEEWAQHHLSDISTLEQKQVVQEVLDSLHVAIQLSQPAKILLRAVRTKQHGYRAQDLEKSLFDVDRFVDTKTIFEKLADASLECFYCKQEVLVFYTYCRDPKQWTLERVDNQFGHNRDNVEIACLQCNVRRRTMYHERYQMTKQCVIRKMPPS